MLCKKIIKSIHKLPIGLRVMVFNATFNNISVVSWWSVLLVEENRSTRRKPPTCRKSLTSFITQCYIKYTSPWAGFEFSTLVVIGTDCIGSCKSNYHTITTTMAPKDLLHIPNLILKICFYTILVGLIYFTTGKMVSVLPKPRKGQRLWV